MLFHVSPDTVALAKKALFSCHHYSSSAPWYSSGYCLLPPSPIYLFCLPLCMESTYSKLGQPGCPLFLIPSEVAPLKQIIQWGFIPLSDNGEPSGFGICSLRSLLSPGCLLGLQRAHQEGTTGSRKLRPSYSLLARYLVTTSVLGIRGFCQEIHDLKSPFMDLM